MSDLADWASAGAAIAAAVAAWKSFSTARLAAAALETARHTDALRQLRETNASVIAESGAAIIALGNLRPEIDATFNLAGAFDGSAHQEQRIKVDDFEKTLNTIRDDAASLRTSGSSLHAASIHDINEALIKAHDRLLGVRLVTEQSLRLQASLNTHRQRLSEKR